MGCDGGTIPRRDELVRLKKKPEQKDKQAELAFKWKHCTIRQLPLQPPVVACGLGRLYSKESVLEGLLDRNMFPESAEHIKNLKDVKNLNLTPNPAFDGTKAEKGDGYTDGTKSPYICPVIGLEMNGKYKFCFLWSCGCVMSERALKAVKSTTCHKCQQSFEEIDIVVLNAEGDDLELMKERGTLRKTAQKKSKRKRSSDDAQIEKTDETSKKADETSKKADETSKKADETSKKADEVSKKADEASKKADEASKKADEASKKVDEAPKKTDEALQKTDEVPKKKIKKEDKVLSKLSNNPSKADDPAYKKSKSTYSIAKDPKASEVFKSIFTSHKSASEQDRAHWVTYNPFYN